MSEEKKNTNNTEEEIDEASDIIIKLVRRIRNETIQN